MINNKTLSLRIWAKWPRYTHIPLSSDNVNSEINEITTGLWSLFWQRSSSNEYTECAITFLFGDWIIQFYHYPYYQTIISVEHKMSNQVHRRKIFHGFPQWSTYTSSLNSLCHSSLFADRCWFGNPLLCWGTWNGQISEAGVPPQSWRGHFLNYWVVEWNIN